MSFNGIQKLTGICPGRRVHLAQAYLQHSARQCWISHATIDAICPQWISPLCALCSTKVDDARRFFLASVKSGALELIPVIRQVHQAHSRILRTLRGIQDTLSEETPAAAEGPQQGIKAHIWGLFVANKDLVASSRIMTGVYTRRRDAVTYLLLAEQMLELAEGELKQLQELIIFLERSPMIADYGSFSVVLQSITQIHDHLLSFNTPTIYSTIF